MTEALVRTPIKHETQSQLLENTRAYLENCGSELCEHLSKYEKPIIKNETKNIQPSALSGIMIKLEEKADKKPEDLNELGVFYITQKKDIEKSEHYFLQAAQNGNIDAMNNLGSLYATEFKDKDKAEEYYLKAVEKDHTGAMNNLAWMYFEERKNRKQSIELSEKAFQKENSSIYAHTNATILLWDNQFKESLDIADSFLSNNEFLEGYAQDVSQFLMLLIAKKQNHLALRIFSENPHKFKDRFKPIYYALMHFMKDEYPNEYLKMGGELTETVDEIIQKIKEMEKAYQ